MSDFHGFSAKSALKWRAKRPFRPLSLRLNGLLAFRPPDFLFFWNSFFLLVGGYAHHSGLARMIPRFARNHPDRSDELRGAGMYFSFSSLRSVLSLASLGRGLRGAVRPPPFLYSYSSSAPLRARVHRGQTKRGVELVDTEGVTRCRSLQRRD